MEGTYETEFRLDVQRRRAKIIDPVEGWVSIRTESNDPIMELTIAPDKQTQVAQMERRFEKLKAAQQDDHQLESPTDSNSTASGTKMKLTFKSSNTNLSDSNIPKLSGPGIKKPPTVNTKGLPKQSSTTGNLLDFDSPKAQARNLDSPESVIPDKNNKGNDFDSWFS